MNNQSSASSAKKPILQNNQSSDKPQQESTNNNNLEARINQAAASMIDKEIQLKQMQIENMELKEIIEQMRNDMETIVLQVKESKLQ